MRNCLTSTLAAFVFLFMVSSCAAQKSNTKDVAFAKGVNNALSIDTENLSRKDAERIWKDIVKLYDGKTKKGKNNEWYTENVRAPKLGGEGEVKMYMKIDEKEKEMTRSIFLVTKNGEFINNQNFAAEAEEVESIFKEYVSRLNRKSVENRLENEKDTFKDLSKDLENLEKDNRKYHEEIEKCKKKIAEMESKIAKNEDEQAMKKEEVEEQKAKVDQVQKKLSDMY